MSRARVAEWLLSQVLPSEQAVTVVGDLIEDTGERGLLWFWSCVIRLAGAKVWQDLSESPVTMIWLGVRGVLAGALAPAFSILLFCVVFLLGGLGHGDVYATHGWAANFLMRNVAKQSAPPHIELFWPIRLALTFVWTVWLFRTGRSIARRAPGREIAASLAVALTGWFLILAAELFSAQFMAGRGISFAIDWTALTHDLALFAGAIRMRRQRRLQAQPA